MIRKFWAVGLLLLASSAGAQLPEVQPGGRMGQPVYGADARTRARIHTELGALYYQDGNLAVALEELKAALVADSSYVPAYSVRGLVHAALRENSLAEEDFRRAINLAPNDPDVNNNYGWFLCQQPGRERQSIVHFLNAVKNPLYETPERAYANAGNCAIKAGDLEGAETYLQSSLRMDREGGIPARLGLALLAYRKGQLEECRRQISDVLRRMEPASPEALWLALRVERKLGNRNAESGYAAQLRSRYPASQEYQEFLKGNFE